MVGSLREISSLIRMIFRRSKNKEEVVVALTGLIDLF
jgi:uncharacterized protein YlxP (DUF503 family)